MGETYIEVDVHGLAAQAQAMADAGRGLHDTGTALQGLGQAFPRVLGPFAAPVQASAALVEMGVRAQRAHGSMLAEVHVRLQQVSDGMRHAADACAHHETYEPHVILKAL